MKTSTIALIAALLATSSTVALAERSEGETLSGAGYADHEGNEGAESHGGRAPHF